MRATAVAVGKPFPASYRKTAVLVGVLFLLATATFAAGSSFITSYFSAAGGQASTLLAGVLLEGISAIAVAGIGVAMWPVLKRYNVGLAHGYRALRIGEGLMIIAAGVYMVTTKNEFFHYDAFIYVHSIRWTDLLVPAVRVRADPPLPRAAGPGRLHHLGYRHPRDPHEHGTAR
jgi:hypothetical protein